MLVKITKSLSLTATNNELSLKKVGKNKTDVQDWQACIRTWEQRKKKEGKLMMP